MGKLDLALYNEARYLAELKAIEDREDVRQEEKDAAMENWIQSITGSVDAIRNVAGFLRFLDRHAEVLKEEADAMTDKRRNVEAMSERIKEKITRYMSENNLRKVEAGTFDLTLRKSEAVVISMEQDIPDDYVSQVIETKIDKRGIKDAIKRGEDVPGAYIEERDNLQIK